jgi:hypothetical protein
MVEVSTLSSSFEQWSLTFICVLPCELGYRVRNLASDPGIRLGGQTLEEFGADSFTFGLFEGQKEVDRFT